MKNILWQTILISAVFDLVSLLSLSVLPGHKSLSSRAVWVATHSQRLISAGQNFIFQAELLHASNLLPFHTSLPTPLPRKLRGGARRPRWASDHGAKSNPQFDSVFWDCQSVACNVSWHFHNPRASLKCPSFYSGKVSFLLPVMFSFAAKGIKRYNPVNWRVIDWPWPCASLFLFLPLSQKTWF